MKGAPNSPHAARTSDTEIAAIDSGPAFRRDRDVPVKTILCTER